MLGSLIGSMMAGAAAAATNAAANKITSGGSSGSSSSGTSASKGTSSGSSSSYYDPNKDYSLAIKQAQSSGAAQSVINQLQQERQNKINAQYGGVDPYKGSSNIMGGYTGSSSWTPSAGYTENIGADAGLSQTQRDAIQSFRNQAKAGQISWDQANAWANELRQSAGGYTVDKLGNVTYLQTQQQMPETDLSRYLEEMYAAQAAQQQAQLEAQWRQSQLALEAQQKQIAAAHQEAKNEAAAQSELNRQAFAEFAVANGLNTGTSGQAQIAQNAALQGSLGAISASEAGAMSENELAQRQLEIEYNSAIAQAQAAGNAALAEALYQEYVRQINQYNQNQQFQASQNQWNQQFQAQQQSDAREYAYNLAVAMIEAGLMPDSATLSAAGINQADAKAMVEMIQAQQALGLSGGSKTASSGGGTSGGTKSNTSTGTSTGTELADLDTNDFTNPHNDKTVQVKSKDGAFITYTWSAVDKLLQSGQLKKTKNSDGTYTLALKQ